MAIEVSKEEHDLLKRILVEDLIVLSQEEIKYLKEYVEDRKAYSRVYSKLKIFFIAISSGILGIIVFFEQLSSFIKMKFGF